MGRKNRKYYYVYSYTRPGELIPFYIGKGCGGRAYDHVRIIREGKPTEGPFYAELKRLLSLNIDPVITILARDLYQYEAYSLEIALISRYGRKDRRKGPLLNRTDGGPVYPGHWKRRRRG